MKNKVFENVGKQGTVSLGGLKVHVDILDYKKSYGRDRFFVTPVAATGEVWVENVKIHE